MATAPAASSSFNGGPETSCAPVTKMRRSVGLLLGCLLIAGCSKNPTEPNEPAYDPPGPASADDIAFCVSETNRYRAERGRPALPHSVAVSERAQLGAESDNRTGQAHGYFNANPFNGAENEALRWSYNANIRAFVGAAVQAFYSEGPGGGHYENMMRGYTEMGCGIATDGARITLVQNFR